MSVWIIESSIPKNIKNPEEEDKNNNTDKTIEDKSRSLRSPILSLQITDMAFRDNVLIYNINFNIYEIDQLGVKDTICKSDVDCGILSNNEEFSDRLWITRCF